MNKGFTEGHFYILLGFILLAPNGNAVLNTILGIAYLCTGIYYSYKENK